MSPYSVFPGKEVFLNLSASSAGVAASLVAPLSEMGLSSVLPHTTEATNKHFWSGQL